MAKIDASPLIGAQQTAGIVVQPIGAQAKSARSHGLGAIGAIGGEIGAKMTQNPVSAEGAATPDFGRAGFLALTTDEVVLLRSEGSWTMKPREVVARVPRSSVNAVELTPGKRVSALWVRLTDGTFWTFEIFRKRDEAEAFVQAASLTN